MSRFSPKHVFNLREIERTPTKSGVYEISDSAATIYVGRSRTSIRERLRNHFTGRGSRAIPEQAEAQLIRALGADRFANLRRETDPADRF